MSEVIIKIYSWLSDSFPGRTLSHAVLKESFQEGETVRDLLDQLCSRYPSFSTVIYDGQTRRFYPHINFIYQGKAADAIRDLDRKLEDGDEIIFVPFYAGG